MAENVIEERTLVSMLVNYEGNNRRSLDNFKNTKCMYISNTVIQKQFGTKLLQSR